MRLKIQQANWNPSSRKVWLEGVELRHVIDLTLEFGMNDATTVTLRIGVDDLDLDVETAAHLIAAINAQVAKEQRR